MFEALHVFISFKTNVEKLLGKFILHFQIDGAEFKPLIPFFKAHGIEHCTTCSYTSKQNHIVEKNILPQLKLILITVYIIITFLYAY